jgi:hypothetical protein
MKEHLYWRRGYVAPSNGCPEAPLCILVGRLYCHWLPGVCILFPFGFWFGFVVLYFTNSSIPTVGTIAACVGHSGVTRDLYR